MTVRDKVLGSDTKHMRYVYCLAGLDRCVDEAGNSTDRLDGYYAIAHLMASLEISSEEIKEAREELK